MLSSVTMATSLSGSTRDFLKTSFHMFPYNEILKSSKVTSDLIFEITTLRYFEIPNFSRSVKGFGSYEQLKFRLLTEAKIQIMTS